MTLRVPVGLLPTDFHARHGRLRDYFHDKDATAVLVGDEWHLEMAWPGGVQRHVDPRIEAALPGWGGIGLSEMGLANRRSGRVLTSLYDTWTLVSWSQWTARSGVSPDERITILHLDDHRDLGSPRLAMADDGLVDLITGLRFDVREPETVLAACESGAVGMGSFLTPFLLAFPNCDVRQLAQPPKVTTTVDSYFLPALEEDDLLSPGASRPAIQLEPAPGAGPARYRATRDLGDWLEGVGPGPVLLHVDMDYFNNRYDGDCDWPDRHPRHDPALESVLAKVDEVVAAIRGADLVDRIEDAVVAFSPGFFPAEMWTTAEARLRAGLPELYD
jgi:hypothetical protein